MKVHVDIDLPVPRWTRNAALVLVPVAVIIATTAIVRASVPNIFNAGDTLSAQKMNDNFAVLDSRLAAGNAVFSATVLPVASPSSCQIVRQDGSWIASATRVSQATCQIAFTNGSFTATPTCVASNDYFVSTIQSVSAMGLTVDVEDTSGGAGPDGRSIHIVCIGPH
jgi:hypothetical protein